MELDPAIGPGQPFLHQSRMVIFGVIQKDVNELFGGIHRHNRDEERNRALRIDGQRLDHARASRLQVKGAVDVEPVPSAVLFHRNLRLFRRPATQK